MDFVVATAVVDAVVENGDRTLDAVVVRVVPDKPANYRIDAVDIGIRRSEINPVVIYDRLTGPSESGPGRFGSQAVVAALLVWAFVLGFCPESPEEFRTSGNRADSGKVAFGIASEHC